jgi:hypothetical protein
MKGTFYIIGNLTREKILIEGGGGGGNNENPITRAR